MDWFKTKKTETVAAPSSPEHLLALVRTMEDDISGREVPVAKPATAEPLVSFRPNATAGAPFFAASEDVPDKEQSTTSETSPFLAAEPAAEPEKVAAAVVSVPQEVPEMPTFDPPLQVAVPEAATDTPRSDESTPIAFSTAPQAAPSLRESFGSMPSFKGAKSFFQGRKRKLAIIAAIALLLVAVLGGLYFWWQSSLNGDMEVAAPDVQIESPKIPEANLKAESVAQAKYSADQPNILSFDTETVTAEQIKSTLLQVGQSIKKDNLPGAVEFLVRDQKLNPLALARFAYLAKLNLPADLLGALDESFSLYVVIDDGRPRLVLLAYAKDESIFAAELKRSEKDLAQAIDSLFLDVTTAPKSNLTFRDGSYLERPVRFANVDASIGLSVDYAVRGRQWIIGTSKDSLRAVLDKTGL